MLVIVETPISSVSPSVDMHLCQVSPLLIFFFFKVTLNVVLKWDSKTFHRSIC